MDQDTLIIGIGVFACVWCTCMAIIAAGTRRRHHRYSARPSSAEVHPLRPSSSQDNGKVNEQPSVCPFCGSKDIQWSVTDRTWICASCRRQPVGKA